MVFQSLWQRRKRLSGQKGSDPHHQGGLLFSSHGFPSKASVTAWPLTFAWLLISQIIHKIKKRNDMSVTEKMEDICDRIFELVDKNKDSKWAIIWASPLWSQHNAVVFGRNWLYLVLMFRSDFLRGIHRRSWKGPVAHEPAQTGHRTLRVVHGAAGEETLTFFLGGGRHVVVFGYVWKTEKTWPKSSCLKAQIGQLCIWHNIILFYKGDNSIDIKEKRGEKVVFVQLQISVILFVLFFAMFLLINPVYSCITVECLCCMYGSVHQFSKTWRGTTIHHWLCQWIKKEMDCSCPDLHSYNSWFEPICWRDDQQILHQPTRCMLCVCARVQVTNRMHHYNIIIIIYYYNYFLTKNNLFNVF